MREQGSDFLLFDDPSLESSVPIDCSEQKGRYYVCPHGEGVPCVDGPSMLCDLKADCPGGSDEKEDACSKCFTLLTKTRGLAGWVSPFFK